MLTRVPSFSYWGQLVERSALDEGTLIVTKINWRIAVDRGSRLRWLLALLAASVVVAAGPKAGPAHKHYIVPPLSLICLIRGRGRGYPHFLKSSLSAKACFSNLRRSYSHSMFSYSVLRVYQYWYHTSLSEQSC